MYLKYIAQGLDLNALEQVTTPALGNPSLARIVGTIAGQYVLPISGFITLGMAVAGGFEYMFSYGDPKKATSAKEKITYGLIGFTVIFSSWWFVRIIGNILDIQIIRDIFGT